MLDLLLLPAVLLLVLALRAVRQGDHRLHGQLMTAAFTFIGLRLLLHPRELYAHHRIIWLATLSAAALTILLGRSALAWREARSSRRAAPQIHRAFGAATLVALALATAVWLMRNRT